MSKNHTSSISQIRQQVYSPKYSIEIKFYILNPQTGKNNRNLSQFFLKKDSTLFIIAMSMQNDNYFKSR
jgi:hypothetical protein